MLNLIRMNLYRMIKTKSLYILLLCSVLLCLLLCYMNRMEYLETQKEAATAAETTLDEEPTTGITIEKIDQTE
ncbi:MAG: hypothetical protein K2J67_06040, partial [Lachnospiraceae bacterium]|nr:hypothetical protein [Lachnospiraceae bacterium]